MLLRPISRLDEQDDHGVLRRKRHLRLVLLVVGGPHVTELHDGRGLVEDNVDHPRSAGQMGRCHAVACERIGLAGSKEKLVAYHVPMSVYY